MEYGSKALRYLDAKQIVASGDRQQISGLVSALSYVGLAYAAQGDHASAVESYRRSCQARPDGCPHHTAR
jgi:hypothetical protein